MWSWPRLFISVVALSTAVASAAEGTIRKRTLADTQTQWTPRQAVSTTKVNVGVKGYTLENIEPVQEKKNNEPIAKPESKKERSAPRIVKRDTLPSTTRDVSRPEDAIGAVIERVQEENFELPDDPQHPEARVAAQVQYLQKITEKSQPTWDLLRGWLLEGAYRWSLQPEETPKADVSQERLVHWVVKSDYHKKWLEQVVAHATHADDRIVIDTPENLDARSQAWLKDWLGNYHGQDNSNEVKNALRMSWDAQGLRVKATHKENASTCDYEGRCFVLGNNIICYQKPEKANEAIDHRGILYATLSLTEDRRSRHRLTVQHNPSGACDLGAILNGAYDRAEVHLDETFVTPDEHEALMQTSARYRNAFTQESAIKKEWLAATQRDPQYQWIMRYWLQKHQRAVDRSVKSRTRQWLQTLIRYRLANVALVQAVQSWMQEADPVRWNGYWGERLSAQSMTWWQIFGGRYQNGATWIRLEPYRNGPHLIVQERIDGNRVETFHGVAMIVGDIIMSVGSFKKENLADQLLVLQLKEDDTQKSLSVLSSPNTLKKEGESFLGDWVRVQ